MLSLKVENISMVYDSHSGESIHALKELSFKLDPGEFFTILGPSGCGKTTLLDILGGFLSPTSGNVFFQNEQVVGPSSTKGMVFQSGALFEWMNVEDNVGFGPKMSHKPADEIKEICAYWLNMVGLQHFHSKPVYALSGGMQQRVALARCLANDPQLILMDEPLGALDALTREKMQALLRNLWYKTGKTIVFITHSVEEAMILGERLAIMAPRPGRIVKEYKLNFTHECLSSHSRLVKTKKDFIELREEILAMIWDMEEEIMGEKFMGEKIGHDR